MSINTQKDLENSMAFVVGNKINMVEASQPFPVVFSQTHDLTEETTALNLVFLFLCMGLLYF